MRWKEVSALGRRLPGVEEGRIYGARALAVHGSVVARLLADGRSIVVKMEPDQRTVLCAAHPETFAVTSDVRNLAMVVVRLSAIDPEGLWPILVGSWRRCVPPHAAAALDREEPS